MITITRGKLRDNCKGEFVTVPIDIKLRMMSVEIRMYRLFYESCDGLLMASIMCGRYVAHGHLVAYCELSVIVYFIGTKFVFYCIYFHSNMN